MRYPTKDGFAQAFDPQKQSQELLAAWNRYGIVVSHVLTEDECKLARKRIDEIARKSGFDIHDECTYGQIPKDAQGTPLLSRGFFEIYHDDLLAQLRQHPTIYQHHSLILGRPDLWITFDRIGIKLPHHEESKALPLHVDQNPALHPGFASIQGVLALVDCPPERGTFVGVPGSIKYYPQYSAPRGEYVQTPPELEPILKNMAQAFGLRAGDLVTWDSRITHSNTENTSDDVRYVAYIAAGPAKKDPLLKAARIKAFLSGEGSNHREALMHASKKPRFNNLAFISSLREPEKLTPLGRRLYGLDDYD